MKNLMILSLLLILAVGCKSEEVVKETPVVNSTIEEVKEEVKEVVKEVTPTIEEIPVEEVTE